MTDLTMKDYSSYLVEKPFACNVEGCSMKFTNEDHLTVHKKRHDMVLNLGLGNKGNVFADQTPTPTSFIRHCEEVGLFQDLQNVNPFEETFKKAAEAVKTGLTPCLDRPFQSNPPDDTLHTPNVFPHITDLTCIPQDDNCTPSEILQNFSKKDIPESIDSLAVYKEPIKDPMTLEKEEDNSHKKIKNEFEKSAVVEIPNGHFIQLVDPLKIENKTPFNMLIVNNQDSNVTVKDKLRKSLNEKTTIEPVMPLKVPIPKVVNNNSQVTNKFSTFTKNAMKLMDKKKSGIFELSSKKRKKKEINFIQKESRSEFLARNRAAATRCREKKKMYIWNLENLNRELTATNQNLQLLTVSLQDQITELRTELLKHKSCNMADVCTEALISKISQNPPIPTKKKQEPKVVKPPPKKEESLKINNVTTSEKTNLDPNDTVMFDFVEVTLNENEEEECHIPLIDTPTNSVINMQNSDEKVDEVPPNCLLLKNVEKLGESCKQVYNEHSYFAKQVAIDVSKRFLNYKSLRTNVLPPDLQWKNLGDRGGDDSGEVNRITTNSVILDTRTPPPLILLKPFKKRNLRSNAAEKS